MISKNFIFDGDERENNDECLNVCVCVCVFVLGDDDDDDDDDDDMSTLKTNAINDMIYLCSRSRSNISSSNSLNSLKLIELLLLLCC